MGSEEEEIGFKTGLAYTELLKEGFQNEDENCFLICENSRDKT